MLTYAESKGQSWKTIHLVEEPQSNWHKFELNFVRWLAVNDWGRHIVDAPVAPRKFRVGRRPPPGDGAEAAYAKNELARRAQHEDKHDDWYQAEQEILGSLRLHSDSAQNSTVFGEGRITVRLAWKSLRTTHLGILESSLCEAYRSLVLCELPAQLTCASINKYCQTQTHNVTVIAAAAQSSGESQMSAKQVAMMLRSRWTSPAHRKLRDASERDDHLDATAMLRRVQDLALSLNESAHSSRPSAPASALVPTRLALRTFEARVAGTGALRVRTRPASLELWHKRYCHLKVEALRRLAPTPEMHKLGKIMDLAGTPGLAPCSSCDTTWCDRLPMEPSRAAPRTSRVLEWVHIDVYGPLDSATFGGKSYIMTLVDDYSRHAHVVLLNEPNYFIEGFKQYREWAEKDSGRKVAGVCPNSNSLQMQPEFSDYLLDEGIALGGKGTNFNLGIATYYRWQLLKTVQIMLHGSGMDIRAWGEAFMTATFVYNISPNPSIGHTLPLYRFSDHVVDRPAPALNRLRPFGCLAIVSLDDIDPVTGKSQKLRCIFAGYEPDNTRGDWRLLKPDASVIITSKRVVFHENVFPLLESDMRRPWDALDLMLWPRYDGD